MAAAAPESNGDAFLRQRLERRPDMTLRRRTAIRDWLLGTTVVCATLLLPGIDVSRVAFIGLFSMAVLMTLLLLFAFPRLSERGALRLEKGMSAIASVGLMVLVAATGGPESPYTYFFALTILFAAAFVDPPGTRFVLVAISSVCALAPLFYDWQLANEVDFVPLIAVSLAFWLAAALLVSLKRDSATRAEFEARRVAYVDPLTGVGTRRAFEEYDAQLRAAGVPRQIVWMKALGVDRINLEQGHMAGDLALVRLAGAMRSCSGARDQVTRLDGGEFAVILAGASPEGYDGWLLALTDRLASSDAQQAEGRALSLVSGASGGASSEDAISEARSRSVPVVETLAKVADHQLSATERSNLLLGHFDRLGNARTRSAIESFDAPSGVPLAIASSLLITVLIAVSSGASSIFLSAAVLLVAWFASFGTRHETRAAAVTMAIGVLLAVLVNGSVSSTDITRVFSILASMALLADTLQRNSVRLRVAEERAAELSLIDESTGIGNGHAFERRLDQTLSRGVHGSLVERMDGRPAVISIDLGSNLDHQQLILAASALRDAIGGDGEVYRITLGHFAVITRAHHEHFLADVIERCRLALIDEGSTEHGGLVTAGSSFGGAIHDSAMTAAQLASMAVTSHPRSRLEASA